MNVNGIQTSLGNALVELETGVPEFTGKEVKLPSPVCIEFL